LDPKPVIWKSRNGSAARKRCYPLSGGDRKAVKPNKHFVRNTV